jgi:preprotein translocase subunit YajC
MKLSETPIDQIKVGDKVINKWGNCGKIIAIQEALFDEDDNPIEILWANNKATLEPQYMYEDVEIC